MGAPNEHEMWLDPSGIHAGDTLFSDDGDDEVTLREAVKFAQEGVTLPNAEGEAAQAIELEIEREIDAALAHALGEDDAPTDEARTAPRAPRPEPVLDRDSLATVPPAVQSLAPRALVLPPPPHLYLPPMPVAANTFAATTATPVGLAVPSLEAGASGEVRGGRAPWRARVEWLTLAASVFLALPGGLLVGRGLVVHPAAAASGAAVDTRVGVDDQDRDEGARAPAVDERAGAARRAPEAPSSDPRPAPPGEATRTGATAQASASPPTAATVHATSQGGHTHRHGLSKGSGSRGAR